MTKILIEIDTDTQRVVPVKPARYQLDEAHNGPLLASDETMDAKTEEWLIDMYKAFVLTAPQPEPVDADLRRDAERYLFLRDKWWFCGVGDYLVRTALTAEELDSAIDAALL